MASTPRALPTPAEILEREGEQKRLAIVTAIVSAVLTALAAILDQVTSGKIPTTDRVADLVETLSAKTTGADFPASFWSAYAQFRVDHALETIAANSLRAVGFLLLIPMLLLLLRGTRDRGGTLGKWLEPLAVVALVVLAVATFLHEVLEVAAFRDAGPAYVPKLIFDAAGDSDLLALSLVIGLASLLISLPIALVSMQAMRVGLLPRVLGFMGVLVGLLFVLRFDQTGLLRAGWFAAVGWVVAGRLAPTLSPAWASGKAEMPAPRQPPAPREPKKGKGGKPPKLTK